MARNKEANKTASYAVAETLARRSFSLFRAPTISKNAFAAKITSAHLKEKQIARKTEFAEKGKKADGDTAGYLAARVSDDHHFMIKSAPKDLGTLTEGQIVANFTELVDEYIVAPLMKLTLYDRAPVVELVVEDHQLPTHNKPSQKQLKSDASGEVMIRSKFLDGFRPLNDILSEPNTEIDGTEKVIAACVKYGDVDFHGDNLSPKMEKIDHGKALRVAFTNEQILRQELVSSFKEFNYKNINFNFEKLAAAIEQQSQITPDEIERIVDARYATLKDDGVKFNNPGRLTSYSRNHGDLINLSDPNQSDQYEAAKATSKTVIDLNSKTLNKLLNTLRIIGKIEGVDAKWKDKQWLYDLEGSDPVVWAALHGKKIEGRDPLKWAIDNDKQLGFLNSANDIDYSEPLAWAAKNKIRIEQKDPIAWAIENNQTIEGNPPLEWALKNNIRIEGKDPIDWADLKGMQFSEGSDLIAPYEYAVRNGKKIDDRDAAIWCIANNKNIAGKAPLEFLNSLGRKVTDEYSIIEKIYRNNIMEGKDPAIYARDKGLQLEGCDIPEWSIISNTQIEGEDAVIWSLKQNITAIAGQHPVLYAHDKGHLIEGKPAVIWAIRFGIKIDDKELATWIKQQSAETEESIIKNAAQSKTAILIDGQSPIAWAVNNNITLDGVAAYLWAHKNNIQVSGESALLWAAKQDNKSISEQALNTAIVNDTAATGNTFDWIKWASDNNKNIFHTEFQFAFDPVTYALFSDLKIEKMNPLAWAIDNDRKVDGSDPVKWLRENGEEDNVKNSIKASMTAGEKVKGKAIVLWLHENNFKIDGQNPVAWAINNNVKILGKDAALAANELGIQLDTPIKNKM